MASFPSDEWLALYRQAINASESHREAAATWEGDLTYVIQAEPGVALEDDVCVWMDLWHGECRDARIVDMDTGVRAKFVIAAPYSRWKQVIRGELEPTKAMMQGKLRLRGDLPTIVQHVKAANELVHIAGVIPTEFLDER